MSSRPKSALPRRPFAALKLAAAALALAACSQGPEAGQGLVIVAPENTARPYFHDFGPADVGDQLSHVFELENTDPDPVTVRRITPACVCTLGRVWCVDAAGEQTIGSFSSEPVIVVPPGARLFVGIDLDTNHVDKKNVDKLAFVRLLSDSPKTPIVNFELHTIVRAPLQITPEQIDMKDVPESVGGYGTVEAVVAVPGVPLRVLGLGETSEGLSVELAEREHAGETVWSVTARLEPGRPLGPYNGWFELRTTDFDGEGEGRPVRVAVRAMVTRDIVLSPAPMAFSTFTPGEGAWSRTLVRALVPGERILVEGASVTGEHADLLRVDWQATDPDATGRSPVWTVTVLAPPELEGKTFQGELRVELDHAELPELRAQYICRPR